MRRLTIFLVGICLSGCTGEWGGEGTAPGTIGTGTGNGGGAGGDLSETLVELANALNRERTDRGLTAVTLRQDLNCAADRHSKDIGAAGYLRTHWNRRVFSQRQGRGMRRRRVVR